MKENDRFSLVSYSIYGTVDIPLTYMTVGNKISAKTAIKALKAGGGTALCDGLVKGTHHTTELLHVMQSSCFSHDIVLSVHLLPCMCLHMW